MAADCTGMWSHVVGRLHGAMESRDVLSVRGYGVTWCAVCTGLWSHVVCCLYGAMESRGVLSVRAMESRGVALSSYDIDTGLSM